MNVRGYCNVFMAYVRGEAKSLSVSPRCEQDAVDGWSLATPPFDLAQGAVEEWGRLSR